MTETIGKNWRPPVKFSFPVQGIDLSVTLKTTTYVSERLDALLESGLFGFDEDGVVEELVRMKLRELEKEGYFGSNALNQRFPEGD